MFSRSSSYNGCIDMPLLTIRSRTKLGWGSTTRLHTRRALLCSWRAKSESLSARKIRIAIFWSALVVEALSSFSVEISRQSSECENVISALMCFVVFLCYFFACVLCCCSDSLPACTPNRFVRTPFVHTFTSEPKVPSFVVVPRPHPFALKAEIPTFSAGPST